jgi:DUF3037 family protein
METKGYYSVVRFVPDAFRGEGVNLGVILLCPDMCFLEWKLTSNHQRARRFFKYETDVERLRVLGLGLSDRLKQNRAMLLDPARLRDFISRHQDMVQLTELRSITVSDPFAELARLFARLVEPASEVPTRRLMNAKRVRDLTASKLQSAGLLHRVKQDVEFEARYRTTPYKFSFGYQNGLYKLIHTTSFASQDANGGCERALVLLAEIDDVMKHQDGHKLEFQVVAEPPEQPEAQKAVVTAFRDKGIRLWTPDAIDPLVEQVKAEIH